VIARGSPNYHQRRTHQIECVASFLHELERAGRVGAVVEVENLDTYGGPS
jgi:hypothetical protein